MITYDITNARIPRGSRLQTPTMSVYSKEFRLNKALSAMLGVTRQDTIEIKHDAAAGEWYIGKGGKKGIPLVNSGGNGVQFCSVVIAAAMADVLPEPIGKTHRVLVSPHAHTIDGRPFHALLGLNTPQR